VRDQPLLPVVAACTAEVLEQMFFIRALAEGASEEAPPDSRLAAAVIFHGAPSGQLILQVTTAAARSIAADFLGEDEPVLSEQQVGEVICELANIICGSVLSHVESESTFHLDTPELQTGGVSVEALKDAVIYQLSLENGRLDVAFQTEVPVCPLAA
jgi:CheY-specific phosphatase CheX